MQTATKQVPTFEETMQAWEGRFIELKTQGKFANAVTFAHNCAKRIGDWCKIHEGTSSDELPEFIAGTEYPLLRIWEDKFRVFKLELASAS